MSGEGETEFCFFEYCFYEQRADAVRFAVLNRSRVRTPSFYRSASASVGSLSRAYSTVGPPAGASVGSPNSANHTVELPASAGSSAIAISSASGAPAASGISKMTTSPTGAKDDGSIQGAGSLVNAAATQTAGGPCVRGGKGKRPHVA